jgi:hypothetical protein
MSGFVGYGLKGLKAGAKAVKNIFKPKKTYGTGAAINKMPVAKDLKKTKDLQEDMIKFRDNLFKGPISEQGKINVKTKNPMSQYLRKQNKNLKKPLASGGRVGKKFGGGMDMGRRKTNIQKIKETFGPKKNLSPKQMKIAKLAGNKNKIDAADFAKLRKS